MSKAIKRLEAMRRNPAGDWTIGDVEAVCRAFGIACTAPARGSHYDIAHPSRPEILIVPFKRPSSRYTFASWSRSWMLSGPWPMSERAYRVDYEPLPASEGGGWLATVPDLPGCMSDGDTREEAEANVRDAIACWVEAARRMGRSVPEPTDAARVA